MRPSSYAISVILAASVSSITSAQPRGSIARASPLPLNSSRALNSSAAARAAEARYGSLALQTLGGTLGSAAGLGLGLAATDDCAGEDDVVCALESLSITGVLGVIGATTGVAVAGRSARERPSIVGSLLGAAAGTALGVGLHHVITEELDLRLDKAGTFALFTISQGTLAAVGGRVGAVVRSKR